MYNMKAIFVAAYMLLSACSVMARADEPSRWQMLPDGSIEWINNKQLPHNDHIEMSGKRVSVVLRYGIDEEGAFVLNKSMIWPLLRTVPNNTHASLMRRFDWDLLDAVTVNGRGMTNEKVENIRLKGMLTIESSYDGGRYGQCKLIREYLPSVELPALVENYTLVNTGKQPMSVEIPTMEIKQSTDPKKGVDGSYLIEMTVDKSGYFTVQPGDTLFFTASIAGYKAGQSKLVIDGRQEK